MVWFAQHACEGGVGEGGSLRLPQTSESLRDFGCLVSGRGGMLMAACTVPQVPHAAEGGSPTWAGSSPRERSETGYTLC